MAPSKRSYWPSKPKNHASKLAKIISGTSTMTKRLETTKGAITAHSPRISRTLNRLLPTTLPMAISPWALNADWVLTAISGALVPKATTVSPTIRGEIPKPAARRAAPRTSTSAPITNKIKPAIRYRAMVKDMESS